MKLLLADANLAAYIRCAGSASDELAGAGGKNGLVGAVARGLRTGKQGRKSFAVACAEALGDFVAEEAAGTKGSGFDGADADAEGFGGFTGGGLSDFRELHDGLENGAELIDGGGKNVLHFLLAVTLFRSYGGVFNFERVGFLVNGLIAFYGKMAGAAFAKKHQGFVDGDAGKPGGEARLALKTFQMYKRLLKGLLNGVLSVFRVLKAAEGDVEHFLVVACEQDFERGAVAADGFGDEGLVLQIREIGASEIQDIFNCWLRCSEFGFDWHACVSFESCRCFSCNDSKKCFI